MTSDKRPIPADCRAVMPLNDACHFIRQARLSDEKTRPVPSDQRGCPLYELSFSSSGGFESVCAEMPNRAMKASILSKAIFKSLFETKTVSVIVGS
jgi:hypothetical protein